MPATSSSTHILSQSVRFHSVPPRPTYPYTLTKTPEIFDSQVLALAASAGFRYAYPAFPPRSSTAPVDSSVDCGHRFRDRAMTTPRVIALEKMTSMKMAMKEGSRGGGTGFFPPVKLRSSGINVLIKYNKPEEALDNVTIIPAAEYVTCTPRFVTKKTLSSQEDPCGDNTSYKPSESVSPHSHLSPASNSRLDDLSTLPKPHRLNALRKDVPFVYRYKVKRSMNQLSKIMASKPGYSPITRSSPQL